LRGVAGASWYGSRVGMNGLDRISSESVRVTTAAEARFRIDAPNSLPRVVRVIALDAASEAVMERIARRSWKHADFLIASNAAPASGVAPSLSLQRWARDLACRTRSLVDEIGAADVVVLLATPEQQMSSCCWRHRAEMPRLRR
jgi:hypothetical protein